MPLAGQLTSSHRPGVPGLDATFATQLVSVHAALQHTPRDNVIYLTLPRAVTAGDRRVPQMGFGHAPYSAISRRPTIIFWISAVPSPISSIGASRYSRSIS